MRFARVVYFIAGIYGLLVLLPQYFLEEKTGRDFPPAITHPEFFYGFIAVAVAQNRPRGPVAAISHAAHRRRAPAPAGIRPATESSVRAMPC